MEDDVKFTPINDSNYDEDDSTDDWDGVDWDIHLGLTNLSDISDDDYFHFD